MFKKKCNNQTN